MLTLDYFALYIFFLIFTGALSSRNNKLLIVYKNIKGGESHVKLWFHFIDFVIIWFLCHVSRLYDVIFKEPGQKFPYCQT